MEKKAGTSLYLLGVAFLGFLSNEVYAAATPQSKALAAVTEGSGKFALDLYMTLKQDQNNLIMSPLGVQIVSAMLAGGAKANTLGELKKVMHFPEDNELLRSGYKELMQTLQAPQLKMANNIFPEETLTIKKDYLKEIMDYYSSKIVPLPFSKDSVSSAKKINDWAMENTNGKIKDIVTSDDVNGIALLLANAIYFKAKWKYTFPESRTTTEKFYTSKDSHVTVRMMQITERYHYAHVPELGAKVLEMPYEGDKFRMIIILPDEIEGLPQVESKLQASGLDKVLKAMSMEKVDVKLPRFKIESTLDLVEPLKKLGLKELFTNACNLTGIFDEEVKVGKVKQKAFIEVNEEGTEAAAVTVAQIQTYSLLENTDKNEFIMDRPAMAMVVQERKTVLFVARISRPA